MAGLGNIFNFDKPGPGVDKHAPKKTGFALFKEIFFEKFWSFIPLSLLYILLCLPIVTIGFADVGLAYVTRNYARRKPVFLIADFFGAIKKNWKQALIVGIINLVITVALIFIMALDYLNWNQSIVYPIGFVISGCCLVVFSFLKYYINMLIVTFRLSLFNLYRNSLLLSSVGLKENLIITGGIVCLYAFFFGLPFATMYVSTDLAALMSIIFLLLTVLFLPAIQAFWTQFWIFPVVKKNMIDPYYEAHPEEAKRDKALLNLFEDEAEEESDGEESIFTDRGSEESAYQSETVIPKQYSNQDIKQMRERHSQNIDDDTI